MTRRSSIRLVALGAGLALTATTIAIPAMAADAEVEFAMGVENQATRPDVTGVKLLDPQNATIRRY